MYSYRLVAAGFRLMMRHDVVVDHFLEAYRFTRPGLASQARLRAELQAFEVHHWEGSRPSHPYLRWLRARCRLSWYRAKMFRRLTDENLVYQEMLLMQEVAFWPAYRRRRKEPIRYDPATAGASAAADNRHRP